MQLNQIRRRYVMLWQLLFLVFSTSWLWAPYLNTHLTYRTSLISQYETPLQPYAWVFRTGDIVAGLLVIGLAIYLLKLNKKVVGWLTLVLGIGMFFDPILTTTCHREANTCQEYFSARYVLHAIETTVTALTFFALTAYDAWRRRKLVSVAMVVFQILYGLLFVTQYVGRIRFNTLTQFFYQLTIVVWLAWFAREYVAGQPIKPRRTEFKVVKLVAASWAFANGILAIVVSLAHIEIVGKLKGLYFPLDNSWLGEHGVIIGVMLLYISRHLARGEQRARQIFLWIIGLETLKYSLVTPDAFLLTLYSLTFVAVFIFRDDFDRGTVPMTWSIRIKDLYYMTGSLLLASLIGLLVLDKDDKTSVIAARTFNHFTDYLNSGGFWGQSHLRTVLLAHTVSAFLAAAAISLLWILFRPNNLGRHSAKNTWREEKLLQKLSRSSEDYFKLWPRDKRYFWSKTGNGFIAYKIAGAVAFCLADPISDDEQSLIAEFVEWAKSRRLKVCFLPVYPGSQKIYEKAGLQLIQIGSSAIIDIGVFLSKTSNDKWWRWQKNRAGKKGYSFDSSSPPHPISLVRQLRKISNQWLTVGGHSEYGFALGHFSEDYLNQCQIFYLKDSTGQVIAFTNQVPQFNEADTITVDLLRYLPEFNNSMQFLLYKSIESVAAGQKKYRYFDLGFVPFAKAKGPVLAIARNLGGSRFSAKGLEQFKNKFDPDWQPNYMAYDGDIGDLAAIALHLEKAMDLE